jgi:hypothetical protein
MPTTTPRIDFHANPMDQARIHDIVHRAERLYAEHGHTVDRISLSMDLTATHLNGCPLDLDKLLAAPDFDFVHDIEGITDHLDRDTGKLTRCFLPRCARPETAGARG